MHNLSRSMDSILEMPQYVAKLKVRLVQALSCFVSMMHDIFSKATVYKKYRSNSKDVIFTEVKIFSLSKRWCGRSVTNYKYWKKVKLRIHFNL